MPSHDSLVSISGTVNVAVAVDLGRGSAIAIVLVLDLGLDRADKREPRGRVIVVCVRVGLDRQAELCKWMRQQSMGRAAVPAAWDSGLHRPLTSAVLTNACGEDEERAIAGHEVPVAVACVLVPRCQQSPCAAHAQRPASPPADGQSP